MLPPCFFFSVLEPARTDLNERCAFKHSSHHSDRRRREDGATNGLRQRVRHQTSRQSDQRISNVVVRTTTAILPDKVSFQRRRSAFQRLLTNK